MTSLSNLAGAALVAATALTGCTAATTASTTSELTGSIDQASFPAKVASVTVAREDGTTTKVPVLIDDTFTIPLEAGGTYRVFLSPDGKSTPLVLDSRDGILRTELPVVSGGGSVAIGSVRYWDPSTTRRNARAQVLSAQMTSTPTTVTCVAGVISGTTQPCADGAATVACAAVDEGDHGGGHCPNMGSGNKGAHAEHDGAGSVSGRPDDGDADDAPTTIAPSVSVNDASKLEPIGVPSLNAPAQVSCLSNEKHHHHHER